MKYLTIREYTSESEAYRDCLKELTSLHKQFKQKINLQRKDRKHALFLLIGAAISLANVAFDLYRKGLFLVVYQIARYILEVYSLVEYFIILDGDTNEEIGKWFKGNLFDIRYKKENKKKIEDIIEEKRKIPFKALSKDQLLEIEKSIQEAFNILSHYSHPTLYSTKDIKNCDFAELILIPIINNCVDAQRTHFFPEETTVGLMFSEFRLCFREFKKSAKGSSSNKTPT